MWVTNPSPCKKKYWCGRDGTLDFKSGSIIRGPLILGDFYILNPGIRDGKRRKILFQAYFKPRPNKPVLGWRSGSL